MDVAVIVAVAGLAQPEKLAAPAGAGAGILAALGGRRGRQGHRRDGGEDEDVPGGLDVARLAEEREREARRDPEAFEVIEPASGKGVPVAGVLHAAGGDLEKVAALVERAAAHEILDLDRERRRAPARILDLDSHQERASGEDPRRGLAGDLEPAQGVLEERTPETTITEHIQPRRRKSRLLPVFTAARPTPIVMAMKYFPSRLTRSRRGHAGAIVAGSRSWRGGFRSAWEPSR